MAPMDRMERFQKEAEGVFAGSAARDNLVKLLDEGSFVELDAFAQGGVITGYGAVEGTQVMVFAECAAPVTRQHSARIKKLYELAIKTGSPVIGLYDSNGGDLKEGNDTLSAYGDLLLWTSNLSGVVPQIAVGHRRMRRLRRPAGSQCRFCGDERKGRAVLYPSFCVQRRGRRAPPRRQLPPACAI